MKKLLFTFAIFLAMQPLFSQITPAGQYNHSGTYVWLANSGTKFYVMDVIANQAIIIFSTSATLRKDCLPTAARWLSATFITPMTK